VRWHADPASTPACHKPAYRMKEMSLQRRAQAQRTGGFCRWRLSPGRRSSRRWRPPAGRSASSPPRPSELRCRWSLSGRWTGALEPGWRREDQAARGSAGRSRAVRLSGDRRGELRADCLRRPWTAGAVPAPHPRARPLRHPGHPSPLTPTGVRGAGSTDRAYLQDQETRGRRPQERGKPLTP
jgi:hypothetical protein